LFVHPIIANDGYLWAWWEDSNTLEQLTTEGYAGRPVMSPDGTRFAYLWHADRQAGSYDAKNEIWIWDYATGQASRVTAQSEGEDNILFVRTMPSWSSDGNLLVWHQCVTEGIELLDTQVAVYDTQEGDIRILHNVTHCGVDAGLWTNRTVEWVADSIGLLSWGIPPSMWFSAIDTEGESIYGEYIGGIWESLPMFSPDDPWHSPDSEESNLINIYDGERSYAGLFYSNFLQWDLLDPHTGEIHPIATLPEMYSLAAPETSLSVYLDLSEDLSNGEDDWALVSPDGEVLTHFALPSQFTMLHEPWEITLSPSGQQVAYVSDAVYVWRDGETTRIEGTEGATAVAWGATRWRVRHDDDLAAAIEAKRTFDSEDCHDITVMFIGGRGRTEVDLNFYLYGQPIRAIGGQIPAETEFTLVDGPVCWSSIGWGHWWKIDTGEVIGWVQESRSSELAPHFQLIQCPGSLPMRLGLGRSGRVISGTSPINVYADHSTESDIIGQLPDGVNIEFRYGPNRYCAEGYTWRRVNYEGADGWIIESMDGVYMIEPIQ
jgi:hypothetical protein